MEKLEHLCSVGRTMKWCSHCGKQWQFFKIKYRITVWSISTSRYYPKELRAGIQTHTCTSVFTAAASTITKKEITQNSTDKGVGIQNVA